MTMNSQTDSERPLVSVVLATYNEARVVEKCLASLRRQETPDFELEILVVDGKSTDGTKEIADQIAAADPRVRVFVNEKQRTPFALNIGLRALGHPFGSSRNSFRTQPEGEAECINFPIMLKAPLLEVGGFDETLFRNQDLDMNQRLRANGYKLYCTWKTQCYYFPKGFLNYAFRNGFWSCISLKKNLGSFRVRHFVPLLFLLTLMFFLALGLGGVFLPVPYGKLLSIPFAAVLGLHLSLGLLFGIQVAVRDKSPAALFLPFAFLALHLCYGTGTFLALVMNAKPNSLPQVLVAARG
ncbi:MAG: hypothetical protein DMG22_04425 [Acidobacteria bacterium]|nr:MAG: hypothetical protein DMG22_04425 [Acidobacteriota bacterium]